MDNSGVDVSVVIPAYNEEARIGRSLMSVAEYLEAQNYSSELVIVDDGSSDGTREKVRQVARELRVPLILLSYARNAGKGYALKAGFACAAGRQILFCDADLASPIEEISRLLEVLNDGADVAIGSRRLDGSNISVHQPWVRERLGKAYTWLVRWLIADVSDATCGLKAFRREAGQDLFGRLRIHGWSFDAEILSLTRRLGHRIDEVPVRWADQAGTRVRLLRDSIGSLIGLVRILLFAISGAHRTLAPLDQTVDVWRNSGDPS